MKFKLSFYGSIFLISTFFYCSKTFYPEDYLPIQIGNSWTYTGVVRTVSISDESETASGELYTLAFHDSSGKVLWREQYLHSQRQIFWAAYLPNNPLIPNISFQPPIPITPFSNKIGDVLSLQFLERRDDGNAVRAKVTYQIENAGQVYSELGTFRESIKVHMQYQYVDFVELPVLQGNSFLWFAKDLGILHMQMPSNEGILIRAKLGEKEMP